MASRPIDEKIVKLSVDNQSFKEKLTESVTSLKGLSDSMSGVKTDGLESATKSTQSLGSRLAELVSKIPIIGSVASSLTGIGNNSNIASEAVNGIGESANQVSSKFSILQTAAAVALGNIASTALSAGLNVAKSLTVQPIMDGYKEYTEKLSAIQVMKSNTTASMDEINGSLKELNAYSDKTIYKFADMTNAVGQMTTAGIDLNASVTATTGAFNLAAASGMDTARANSMVQFGLTQAMTKGFLGVQDLVSFGAAGGKKFQDMAHQVANELGVGYDTSVSFRDSLQDGWLNTEVLTETMKRFGEDKSMTKKANEAHSFGQAMDAINEAIGSGWASVWEALIGDFDEATTLWTAFQQSASDAFKAPLKQIEELALAFVKFGGRTAIIDALVAVFKGLQNVLGDIGNAWKQAFPKSTETSGQLLANIFKALTIVIQIMLAPLQLVGPAFQIIFGIMRIGADIVKLLLTPFTTLVSIMTKGMNFSASVKSMTDWSKVLKVVSESIQKFFSVFQSVFSTLTTIVANTTISFVKFGNTFINTIGKFIEGIAKWITSTSLWQNTFGKISTLINNVSNSIKDFIGKMKIFGEAGKPIEHFSEVIKSMSNGLKSYFEGLDRLTSPLALLNRQITHTENTITPLMIIIGNGKAIIDLFIASLIYLKDTIVNIGDGFKAFFSAIKIVVGPLEKLKDNFVAMHPAFKPMADGLSSISRAASPFVKMMMNLLQHITGITSSLSISGGAFKDFSVTMANAGKSVDMFIYNLMKGFNTNPIITKVKQLGKDIVDGLTTGVTNTAINLYEMIKPALLSFITGVKDLFGIHSPSRVMMEIGRNIIEGLVNGISAALSTLPAFFNKVKTVFSAIIDIIANIFGKVPNIFRTVVESIGKLANMIAPYMDSIKIIFGAIATAVGEFLNQINMTSVLKGGIIVALAGWIRDLDKSDGPNVFKKLIHPLQTIKDILKEKFGDGGGMLDQLKSTLKSYQKEIRTKMLVDISVAIGVLAGAMWILSTIPANKLIPAALAMGTAAGSLALTFKTMDTATKNANGVDIAKITLTMIGISIALGIMAKAMSTMSGMNPKEAIVGVLAMSTVIGVLSLAVNEGFAIDEKKSMVKIGSLLVITFAISKLGDSVLKLSKLSWEQMGVGLISMGSIIGMLALIVQTMKLEDTQSIVSFTGLALALNLAVLPIIALGLLPLDVAIQGILSVGAILLEMTIVNVALEKLGGNKGTLNLMAMGVALNLAILPIVALGFLPWPKLMQGLIGMAAALTILAGINVIISKFGGSGGSASLIAMGVALNLIVGPIAILGTLPWQVVAAGVIGMGAALGVLLAAALGAQLILPGVLALSGLLSSFSLASLAFGLGATLVVSAIAALATVVITQGKKFVEGLGDMLEALGKLGPSLGKAIGTLVGGLITGFASAMASNFKELINIGADLIAALVSGILKSSDVLIKGIVTLFNQLVSAILAEIPIFAVKIGNGIIQMMNTLAMFIRNNTDNILHAVAGIMGAVIVMITTALGDILGLIPGIGPDLKKSVIGAGKEAADGLAESFPPGMNAATQKGAEEAIKGLSGMKASMKEEALQLSLAAQDGASQVTTFLSVLGVQGADQFVQGVKSGSISAEVAGGVLKQMAEAGATGGNLSAIAEAMGGTYKDGIFTPKVQQEVNDAAKKLPGGTAEGTKPTEDHKKKVKDNTEETLKPAYEVLGLAQPEFLKGGKGIKEQLTEGLNTPGGDHSKPVQDEVNTVKAGIITATPGVVGAAAGLNNQTKAELDKTSDHSAAGKTSAGTKAKGVNSSISGMNSSTAFVNQKMKSGLDITTDHSGAGSKSANTKVSGVNGAVRGMDGAVGKINGSMNGLSIAPSFYSAGYSASASKGNGVGAAKSIIDGNVNAVNRKTSDLGQYRDYSHTGYSMVSTISTGMTYAYKGLQATVHNITEWISDNLKGSSPTKKGILHDHWYGIVNTGGKIITEFSKSMDKNAPKLYSSTERVTSFISNSLQEMNDSVDTDLNISPTITPVLDMSNLKDLSSLNMQNLNTDITSDISASLSYSAMNQNAQQSAQTNSLMYGLRNTFAEVKSKLNELNENGIKQIDAIMNSNADIYVDKVKVGSTLSGTITDIQQDNLKWENMLGGRRP